MAALAILIATVCRPGAALAGDDPPLTCLDLHPHIVKAGSWQETYRQTLLRIARRRGKKAATEGSAESWASGRLACPAAQLSAPPASVPSASAEALLHTSL